MKEIPELFGSMVFNDAVMRQRLPRETYKALNRTIAQGRSLDPAVASVVANAMKDWALEKGATHYTHWFQPLNGVTAEKHDSFVSPTGEGRIIMELTGKELVKGEPDASSFPSGGLRATFEARGYTAWDPTSYAFIKDNTLCIPTAFSSYTGEALDQKTPLLRSMETLNRQALRIMKLFGHNDVTRVLPSVGCEQEYFLVDKKLYEKRKDLRFTGRTLFGAKPPKGQELEDHYFGAIKPRVKAFMEELDEELWKLGILAKTEHMEAAPGQYELAPVYTTSNLAADQNQLMMELMKRTADHYDLVCLLHEKPFAGVNGSGKHNNWSVTTDTGINLLDPSDTPYQNTLFLVFLAAMIKAVDDHQDLLRISVASAANDHRLGAAEAPPAIVSIYLGDELMAVLDSIENDVAYEKTDSGTLRYAHSLPRLAKDSTDRNRTSPFAFTGNKFEFRMLGSSQSVSDPNTVLNTIVADTLRQFADGLDGADDLDQAVHALLQKTIRDHKRVLFSGDGYADAWQQEAEKRGLLNLRTTPEALERFTDPKNIELFAGHRIFTETEIHSRYEIKLEGYCKVVGIEANTMLEMARKQILPAVSEYIGQLSDSVNARKAACPDAVFAAESDLIRNLSEENSRLYENILALEKTLSEAAAIGEAKACADFYCGAVRSAMDALRGTADRLETITGEKNWPYPTYGELLFGI
ncbi:MAG: glutamine synthetase III [Oscillospiraceae bacterium]|nr:glutamine synthetase III [Oscillospiraceae bacterium]